MINWKTIVGILLIFGVSSELLRLINDYNRGTLEFWPFGVEIGAILAILGGIWLIKSGLKDKSKI